MVTVAKGIPIISSPGKGSEQDIVYKETKKESPKFRPSWHLKAGRTVAPGCNYITDENCSGLYSFMSSMDLSGFNVEKKVFCVIIDVSRKLACSIACYQAIRVTLSETSKQLKVRSIPLLPLLFSLASLVSHPFQLFIVQKSND